MQRSRSTAAHRLNLAFVALLLALVLAGFAYGWTYMNRPGTPPPRATLILRQIPPVPSA